MCDCYKIGWISEDPDCPVHGREAVQKQEAEETRFSELEAKVAKLESDVEDLLRAIQQLQNPDYY